MKKSKIIQFDGKDVTCKELTVEELGAIMESKAAPTALDLLFATRLPVAAVLASTGLTAEALQPHTPSALDALWTAVEEVNPFFLQMLQRMVAVGKLITGQ
jgi:hypothetical protein